MFKKFYFLFMFFAVLFFSCSKENGNEDEIKPVTHKKSGTSDWIQVPNSFYVFGADNILRPAADYYGFFDISFGADGSAFCIASTGYGQKIFRQDGSTWYEVSEGARGTRIAVDPQGTPWHLNLDNSIYRWTGSSWQQMPGKAKHIAISANGAVYIIGTDEKIYYWNGTGWIEKSPGARGVKVAVDPNGNPWHLNKDGNIYRWTGSGWTQMPGKATEISINLNGPLYNELAVYMIGTDGKLYYWNGTSWTEKSPGARPGRIAVDPSGCPWHVGTYGHLFRWYSSPY